MAFEFRLPDIGEGVVEGEIVRWLVREGESIREDQAMVEVMTDKATVEIPSPRAGVVAQIHVQEGKTCKVGEPMVTIDDGNGAVRPAAEPVAAPKAEPASKNVDEKTAKVLTAPATRKLARDLGVDLATVAPTGPAGRITPEDVQRASTRGAAPGKTPARAQSRQDERIPLRGLRKKIAEHMALAKQKAAHFTYVDECDVTQLCALKERAQPMVEPHGIRLTYLPFIVKAVVAALKKYPMCNAVLDEEKEELIYRRSYHIGIATATEAGLVVPVVRDADQRTLVDLAREIDRLAAAAREGRAERDELRGSTFTITSLGALGGVMATPIINHPEVAILGVHKFSEQARVLGGQIQIRQVGNLSISLDHRVVDGFEGAKFLAHVIRLLEDPGLIFLSEQL